MSKFEDLATIFGLRKIFIREKQGERAEVEVIKAHATSFPCPVCKQQAVVVGDTKLRCANCGSFANWQRPERQRPASKRKTVEEMLLPVLVSSVLLPLLCAGAVACLLMLNF